MFGNPGTTELPIMEVMPDYPQLKYVLGLYESVVVGMADGYARASNKLAACNVHVAPGLGNAMGALYNAKFSGSPLILTAGQQEQGHGLLEPLLYAPLVPIAQPLVKWAVEVTRAADLPLDRAARGEDRAHPAHRAGLHFAAGRRAGAGTRVRARGADPGRRAQPALGRGAGAHRRQAARGEQPGDPRRPRTVDPRRLRRGGRAGRTARRRRVPADRPLRRDVPERAPRLPRRADAQPESGARRARAVRSRALPRRGPAAHVGLQPGRSAARGHAGGARERARLGAGQEPSDRVRRAGQREAKRCARCCRCCAPRARPPPRSAWPRSRRATGRRSATRRASRRSRPRRKSRSTRAT